MNVARARDDFSKTNADRDDVIVRVSPDEIISIAYRWHWLYNHIQSDNFKFKESTFCVMHRKMSTQRRKCNMIKSDFCGLESQSIEIEEVNLVTHRIQMEKLRLGISLEHWRYLNRKKPSLECFCASKCEKKNFNGIRVIRYTTNRNATNWSLW